LAEHLGLAKESSLGALKAVHNLTEIVSGRNSKRHHAPMQGEGLVGKKLLIV
jgi:hypothetical protein